MPLCQAGFSTVSVASPSASLEQCVVGTVTDGSGDCLRSGDCMNGDWQRKEGRRGYYATTHVSYSCRSSSRGLAWFGEKASKQLLSVVVGVVGTGWS